MITIDTAARTIGSDTKFFSLRRNGDVVGTLQVVRVGWTSYYVSNDDASVWQKFSSKASAMAFAETAL